MKPIEKKLLALLFPAIILSCIQSCTSNPIGDNEIDLGQRKIQGTVRVLGSSHPEDVFVWLKNQNLWTYTGDDGDFEFILPRVGLENPAHGGIDRDTVIFYLANYYLKKATVLIVDGEFRYPWGQIDKDGRFLHPIMMEQLLNISTEVTPQVAMGGDSVKVFVKTELSARSADEPCVTAVVPFIPDSLAGPLAAVFLRHLDTGRVTMFSDLKDGNNLLSICDSTFTRYFFFDLIPERFPLGRYEIIPYIWINPPTATRELLEMVSLPYIGPNVSYVSIPMKREGGAFEIRRFNNQTGNGAVSQ